MEAKKGENITKKFNVYMIFIAAAFLLGIVLMYNIFLAFSLNSEIEKNAEAFRESQKPASIELTVIRNSKCTDCLDTSAAVDYVKSSKANITKETVLEFGSAEAKEAIIRYNVERVPSLIITGEIEKLNLEGFAKSGNALLLQVSPPYTNAETGEIIGMVKLYIIKDPSCKKCNSLGILISQIKMSGIKIASEKNLTQDSAEGRDIINKYDLGFVPALVMSKDAGEYQLIQQAWPQIGTKEKDGNYVLRSPNPPYINITTGKLRGLVNAIYLEDRSCAECYNVSVHRQIITSPQSFAMALDKEETFDVSDATGKELVLKYNITQVPTIILSDEVEAYSSSPTLRQFFSVEKDGSYVFRAVKVMGAYKDLAANQVVKQQQGQEQT